MLKEGNIFCFSANGFPLVSIDVQVLPHIFYWGETGITNNSENASLFVYLAPSADAVMDGRGQEVKPGKSRNFTMESLGDLNDTFLLVHNLSSVNDAGYILEIGDRVIFP